MESKSFEYLTYKQRIDLLREKKLAHTEEKRKVIGYMDMDDLSFILPPVESRKIISTINASGVPVTDVVIKEFTPKSNHPSGGFFGAKSCGENFRTLLEAHPIYIDPLSSIAGAYMVNFMSYRDPFWNPDLDFPHLKDGINKYKIVGGIGAVQHFCHDLGIGFKLGFTGLLEKIQYYRSVGHDAEAMDIHDALENIILGIQNWIYRHVVGGRKMAEEERHPQLRQNLIEMADINERLISAPPVTFREAVQWMDWFQLAAKMYYLNGALGCIDQLLYPYYKKDKLSGKLSDEEAVFHLACHILRDTSYTQVGGLNEKGVDTTNELSFLMLEAAHLLKIPTNVGVCVGNQIEPNLLKRGVEILFEDKTGIPKFLGIENTSNGFARNGYTIELARERAYSGCHWSALPGKEYTMNDCIKINFASVFEVAFNEMIENSDSSPSIDKLWKYFETHLRNAIKVTAKVIDFHMDNMYKVFPELILDILCYGPIEKGRDATHGGVEFYNICVDGAALATVADSFAAIIQRVENENRISWNDLVHYLKTDWSGADGERARLMMKNIPRYGSGSSLSDEYAKKISETYTKLVKEEPTPHGFNMIPGLFSWAITIAMGKDVGATPNGRHSKDPISHGPNPDPGFRKDNAPTALSSAVASVQSGFGNACPLQIELDPGISRNKDEIGKIASLIKTHFDLGGTQININILDKDRILKAHKNPENFPDLVVRVTGFSTYFANLSPEFRQIVVDRILSES